MLDDLFKIVYDRIAFQNNQIAIKYWLWYALLQKRFQAYIVFKDQLWVSLVEFRKCFTCSLILEVLSISERYVVPDDLEVRTALVVSVWSR